VVRLTKKAVENVASAQYTKASMKQRMLKVGNLVFFFLYPSLCARVFTIFKCDAVYDELYFALDYTKKCLADDWDWNIFAGVAVGGMFLYVLGIPILTAAFLYSANSKELMHPSEGSGEKISAFLDVKKYVAHQDTFNTYGDIYTQYTKRAWYFELCVMLYKMILTGALILVSQGTPLQVLVGVFISFGWAVLLAYKKPYDDMGENWLAIVSATQLFLTMLIGLALSSGIEDAIQVYLGILVVALNAVTIIFAVLFLASRLPYVEKLFRRRFFYKLFTCRFDMCVHKEGCCHSAYKRACNVTASKDRKSTRLNSSHVVRSRMPSSA
jgi:hypothetical protein